MRFATTSTRLLKVLLGGTALSLTLSSAAFAQVSVTDARTTPIDTETSGDITIADTGTVTVTTAGPAVTVNSNNSVNNAGGITIADVDGATAVLLEGGDGARSFTSSGSIEVSEDYEPADIDDDPATDTGFAEGTGRTGILVSGASPFTGNITLEQASTLLVEGNNSYGVNLANTPVGAGLDGTLRNDGQVVLRGDNGAAFRVASGVTGDVINNGAISVNGTGSNALDVSADIDGGFANNATVTNSGFRFDTRAPLVSNGGFGRRSLTAEDLGLAGSAIRITSNVGEGISLGNNFVTTTAEDGTETTQLVSVSQIVQTGSAPAVIVDGEGTPIVIGRVSPISDPTDPNFNEDLRYAFISNAGTALNQQPNIDARGTYNDFDATAIQFGDVTLEGGLFNSASLSAQTFVGAVPTDIDGVDVGTGLARVIVFGDGAISERITQNGVILAQAQEAADEVYENDDTTPAPRVLEAIAIDLEAGSQVATLENNGVMSAIVVGRDGTAIAVRDLTGSLATVTNRGAITVAGRTSDVNGRAETDFRTIALDLSTNTVGVTFLQERQVDTNPDDDITPTAPFLIGDVLLGSGDDSVTATAGSMVGDLAFGAGDDTLTLTDTLYAGAITNSGGLDITVSDGAGIALTEAVPVDITRASFDGTTAFSPVIDGATGLASTLRATDSISFAEGTAINPTLTNVLNAGEEGAQFALAEAADLTVANLTALNALEDGSFLFDTAYEVQGDTLFVTVDLRGADALGLDTAQTGVGGSVFSATLQALQANTGLGNEIANIGEAGAFYAAYNQLLPEFSAAARQFVVANTDGAIGAVANHLDSARRSQEKPGGVWIQEFGYFADRELSGLSEQYRGEGFGFTGGLDTAMGPFHAVGVNFGFASTEIEDVVGVDEPLDVTTLIAGLYAGWEQGGLGVDFYGGAGYNDFSQSRRVAVGSYSGDAEGDWSGTHLTGSVRAGYDIALGSRFWARPTVSLDYLRLSEKAHDETGDTGVALSIGKRNSEVGAVSAMMNVGAMFEGKRTWIRPSVRVGYRNEFLNDAVQTDYRFLGIDDAIAGQILSSEFPSSGALIGFSVAAGSGYSSVGFDFDSDIRDGFIRHTGRIVIRMLF